MSSENALPEAYRPNHDETARQNFVGALKGFLNGKLEVALDQRYQSELEPGYRAAHGKSPANRDEGLQAFGDDHLYQLWGAAVYTSQDLMWETVDHTCQRVMPAFVARRQQIEDAQAQGSLELNPNLDIPEPIRSVEIHRQPGGYFAEHGDYALLTGLRYFGTVELYRAAKGLSADTRTGAPGMGHFILGAVRKRFGDIAPAAVLDLGCGTGTETIAYKDAFPQADVWGVDLSGPLLSFAHTWSEDAGRAIHYRQADARMTGFDDASFDLIVSNILFHETSTDVLPAIMREAHRLLKPGGIFLNADTPFQPHNIPIPKQVTNHWQVINNGEPFWTGYADMDMGEELVKAGFDAAHVFADYDPLGQGVFHIFGARKADV
ncbi:MAG: class I SAM-dependent methyltransferase [Pseudomonadota bacterium]